MRAHPRSPSATVIVGHRMTTGVHLDRLLDVGVVGKSAWP
jgi:hypothetical protein